MFLAGCPRWDGRLSTALAGAAHGIPDTPRRPLFTLVHADRDERPPGNP